MLVKAKKFDLARYAGKWFQIRAFQTWFQKDLTNVTATYTIKDTYIEVKNTGRKGKEKSEIIGKAFSTDKPNMLKVQFYWPFKADYIIEFVDKDYQYAIVGSNKKNYLWILARKKPVSPAILDELIGIARKQGYDTSKLQE